MNRSVTLVEPKWISSKDLGRTLPENGNPPTTLPENRSPPTTLPENGDLEMEIRETRNFLLKHGNYTHKSIRVTPKSLI